MSTQILIKKKCQLTLKFKKKKFDIQIFLFHRKFVTSKILIY
jgi:hypothetical protein